MAQSAIMNVPLKVRSPAILALQLRLCLGALEICGGLMGPPKDGPSEDMRDRDLSLCGLHGEAAEFLD